MKNKKVLKTIICIIIVILITIIFILTNKKYYKEAINNIKYNYNNTLNKNIDLPQNLQNNNYLIMGNLKSEHTSNLVHSANQIFEKNSNFLLKKDNKKLEIYLDDKYTEIDLNEYYNLFDLNKIDTCVYIDKTKETDNKYNYKCGSYNLSIYTTKILNKYIKSVLNYEDITIEFRGNTLLYKNKNKNIELQYTNIQEDNYVLEVELNDKKFKVYYSFNEYSKYSFVYDKIKFNIINDKSLVLSMKCDTKNYSNLKLTLKENEVEELENYKEVTIDEILSLIFSEEIYSLFN